MIVKRMKKMKTLFRFMVLCCVMSIVTLFAFVQIGKACHGPGDNHWPPPGFSELAADQNPTFPDALVTAVAVAAPLPSTVAPHPAKCDVLHFLRIRHTNGPADPWDADKILIAQPGVLEGASAFYNVGANLVTRAYDEKNKFVEFWAIDRRSNTLEDLNGIRLARATGDPYDFIDYYYLGKPYNGNQFEGFLDPYADAEWLIDQGMQQTIEDWHTIITRGIPDQKIRKKKVYLGGHSMGGFITGRYACWDFDGDPTTTKDAGYNQCAGFFGLDTLITADSLLETTSSLSRFMEAFIEGIPENFYDRLRAGNAARFVSMSGMIDPEIMNLLTGFGMVAAVRPKEESESIDRVPLNENIELSYRFFHSRNLSAFFAANPSITKFRYTNEALFANLMDDNTMPISIIRASVGFLAGGPVADKKFPLSSNLAEAVGQIESLSAVAVFLGGGNVAIATNGGGLFRNGPLYGWRNYNELKYAWIPRAANGERYTSPDKEVTDIADLARAASAIPMDFLEKYFPMRLLVDAMTGAEGIVHPDGVSKRPSIHIVAGDGPDLGGDQTPAGSPVLAGYDHLDVLTAAPVQNNGEPEPVSTHLLEFIFGQ